MLTRSEYQECATLSQKRSNRWPAKKLKLEERETENPLAQLDTKEMEDKREVVAI
jgi:DNA-binding CsgD family transcriptional regulator